MTALSASSAIQRLVEQTIGLAQAMRVDDPDRALQLARDMRDGGWAIGLTSLGATAGALVDHLTDRRATLAIREVALDALFAEVHSVSAMHRANTVRVPFVAP